MVKTLWNEIKWMSRQAKPFSLYLILVVAIGVMLSLCGVGIAIVSKIMIDAAIGGDGVKAIRMATIFALLILAQVGLGAVNSIISARTEEALANAMRIKAFARLSHALWMDFNRYHSDDVLTRLTSDMKIIAEGIVRVVPGVISLTAGFVAAFVTLFLFDPILAILAFTLGPASILISRLFARRLKQLHISTQEAESAYRAFLHETIQNMLIVKTFCLERGSEKKIHRLQNERLAWILKKSRMSAAASSVFSMSYWVGYFLAFGWGAMSLTKGSASFGTLTAFLQLVDQVQSPLVGLAYTIPELIAMTASAGRLMELTGLPQEEMGLLAEQHWDKAGVCLKDISFSYENEKPVLRGISIGIEPGELVAVTGASGEGKTTLIRLLMSLLHSQRGQLYFTDAKGQKHQATAACRSLISYVPQGNTLFSGTIEENLYMGNPSATPEEMEAAARQACAWEFISELPQGLRTAIGERGMGLSEGQAQRIAIARALLRRVPILILDEATSALDMHTEINVLKAVRASGRTCIIITHRATAIEFCHRTLRMAEGTLEEHMGFREDSATRAV